MPQTLRVLKLGTECRDTATGLRGTLTHWIVNQEGYVTYLFQPRGIDDDGQPIRKTYLCGKRLEIRGDSDFEQVEVPLEILGTIVEDKASGFKGIAVDFIRHINGCFHVTIQPQGTLAKTKSSIDPLNFDLRGCKGKKITELSEAELKKSTTKNPSPTGDDLQQRHHHRF